MRNAFGGFGLVLVWGTTSPVAAQTKACDCAPPATTGASVPADSAALPNRPVTLTLRNVPLAEALRVLNRQGDLRLAFTDRVLPAGKQVSLVVVDVPARQALATVLKGTGLAARASTSGQLVVARVPETGADSSAADRQGLSQTIEDAFPRTISPSNDVPEAYRQFIADYYKAIAHRP